MARKEFLPLQQWGHYINIFGGMPSNGRPGDTHCGIGLAFGRNSIPDKDIALVRRMREKEGSDFSAIKKLAACGFKGGVPNNEIGGVVTLFILGFNLPMIVQWEIGVVLFQKYRGATEHLIASKKLFILWPRPGQASYRTREVLQDAMAIMRENGWNSPLLVAHDLHMPRVFMLARKLGVQPIVGFKSITRDFDPKSVQPPTSSLWRWLLTYEPWGRIHHLLHGWV
ncbi:MAG: hypothetical protein U1A26_01585 [Candidatus Sungbacteria bacterium]|nr:hypothetical protein [Candidatus Sungbacteria bacterium]